ncbi:RNA polymerase primary sigma factor [Abditibacterium utsteinense]|uniref:RNA polymerase primary sigma factor n=1 Tax=Abditibacterium utsteinense TaxID=1960156 RepID=A0A2S8SVY8_9BACT|nr:sigma-70 family RNA polymerase sigma factor [Abditibacterium utsteinense]PQV64955.1 RNA polymerase primary sigma factor [Abditibacterium utsteinense]
MDSSSLSHPAVAALIQQGARDGRVSYSQINDLLIDLELDEDAVDELLETLEKRAIVVSDAAPDALAPVATPKKTAPQPQKMKAPKTGDAPTKTSAAGNEDLDALLAQLDEFMPTDVDDVAQLASETPEELDDEFVPIEDALKLYLNRMGQIPRLSPEAERELAGIARDGSEAEKHEAQNKLVEANLRLVVHLAHHAAPRTTLSITDLLQEGNLGLLDAVSRYRPESNKTFGAYATWWIRRALNRAITEHSRSMKLSGDLYEAIQKMQAANRQLTQTLGRTPSRQEMAEFSGLTMAQIEEAQRAAINPLSLDSRGGNDEDGEGLGENLADDSTENVENAAIRQEVGIGLTALLDELSEREKLIVQMRFGLGEFAATGSRASEDVAKVLKISRDRVHEIELRALRKLRRKAKGSGLAKLFGDGED